MKAQRIIFTEEKYTDFGIERTRLTHSNEPPFDGEAVLIALGSGWVEAWWEEGHRDHGEVGGESSGFQWICLDDKFQAEFDEPMYWAPLPEDGDDE